MRIDRINVGVWPDVGWHIQWKIEGIQPEHIVRIERASGPEGPWTLADEVDGSTITHSDDLVAWRGFFTVIFYRLTVLDEDENILAISRPVTTSKAGDKITAEIIRQYELLLGGVNSGQGYGSWDFACYKHTKLGTKCFYCVDPASGERGLIAKCPKCMGTGYLEGWTNPVLMRGRWLNPVQKATITDIYGASEDMVRQLWTSAFPVMEPGDVLVEKNTGRAWRVKNITSSEPNGSVVSQSMTVSSIDKQKIEGNLTYPGEEYV